MMNRSQIGQVVLLSEYRTFVRMVDGMRLWICWTSLTPRYRYFELQYRSGLGLVRLGLDFLRTQFGLAFPSAISRNSRLVEIVFPPSSTRPLDSAAQHIQLDRPGILPVAYFALPLMQLAISWRGDEHMRYHKSWPSIAFGAIGCLGGVRGTIQTDETRRAD